MRVSSVAIGLVGVLLLLAGLSVLFSAFVARDREFGIALAPAFVLAGAYFSWIPYLVIRRYSRAAFVHFWIGAVALSFGFVIIGWQLAHALLFSE